MSQTDSQGADCSLSKFVDSVVGDSDVILRSHLSSILAEKHKSLPANKLKEAVDIIIDTMRNALVEGSSIEIRGFGSFGTRLMRAHKSRNPKTGKELFVEDRKRVHFKPGLEFKNTVNTIALNN